MILSILCVTRAEPHAWKFISHLNDVATILNAELVIGADRLTSDEIETLQSLGKVIPVTSKGYVESVLDEVLSYCSGDHVLRMDDDERCSPAMIDWLKAEEYLKARHWKFCTANLWGSPQSVIINPPLWPDHHTRLSIKEMAGGRHTPHCGSPFGGGELAPVIHEHHKFLVKTYKERKAIAARYDAFAAGYGTSDSMRPFSLPETCYEQLTLAPLGEGIVRAWECEELLTISAWGTSV